jgi:hypothetical protein
MKLYVDKTFLRIDDLELVTELLFVYPLLSEQAKNYINTNRFWESGLFDGLDNVEYSDEKTCDFFALPFKFKDPKEERFVEILNKSRFYNKKLICLNNDDFGGCYDIPDDVILFRTSFYASEKKKNEYAFPVFIPDISKHSKGFSDRASIGFCGDSNRPIRKEALDVLKSSGFMVQHDEVFSFFQNPYANKIEGRRQFFNNLQNNIFILCPRGCGNFSYRFYETMCFGRIPVFINTDSVLPFENLIDYKNEIVFVEESDLNNLPVVIEEYCRKHDLQERQKRCREIWIKYFSPKGFVENIKKII